MEKDSIRQKSAFSCEPCRRRKVKCDTGHPRCHRCVARGETCTYKLSPSLSYTKKLETRIAALESALTERTSTGLSSHPPVPSPHASSSISRPSDQSPSSLPGEDVAERPGLKRDDRGHISFHGRTSLINLVLAHGVEHDNENATSTLHGDQGKQELMNSAWTERALERLSNLPEAIQFLLDSHWCWVQPLFNFVYRPAFTRDLKTNGQYCSVLLLDAVLSHSVRWAKADPNVAHLLEPFDCGASFARQARANLMGSLQSGPPSIPTVQALLLLSAQECGQGHLTQAWLYSGMAFRLIEDLGIVFDGRKYAGALNFSTEEIEIRNRLFWSCYLWDKLISLYLGRLPVLQETSVSPPRVILDDTSEIDVWIPHGLDQATSANYPPTQAHTTTCFINTSTLMQILNALLSIMYNPSKESTLMEAHQCAVEQERRLAAWYEQLPAHLKIQLFPLPEHSPPSHIVTLNCLYHTTRILLHRPLLTTYGRHTGLDSTQNEHHLRQCLESANATLLLFNLFCRSFGDGHVILSQAYAVYTAASIFLLHVQATKDFASQAMENLRYSVNTLERLKATSPVLGTALASIYRALQDLSPDMVTMDASGAYRFLNPGGIASSDDLINSNISATHVNEAGADTEDFNLAVPDFSDLGLPADLFSMLPDIEPISANVNAALDGNQHQWIGL